MNRPQSIRILLVEPNESHAKGLSRFLAWDGDLEVVGHAASDEEALNRYATVQPEVVLVNAVAQEANGPQVAAALVEANPLAQVVLYCHEASQELLLAAANSRIAEFVTAFTEDDNLSSAVRGAAARGRRLREETGLKADRGGRDEFESGRSNGRGNGIGPLRVLVVDNIDDFRAELVTEIKADSGLMVVGEADDGDGALRQYRSLEPDVLSIDLRMPAPDGIEASWLIQELYGPARILMVAMPEVKNEWDRAREAGVSRFLEKPRFRGAYCDELKKVALLPPRPPNTVSIGFGFQTQGESVEEAVSLIGDVIFGRRELDRTLAYQIDAMGLIAGTGSWTYLEPEEGNESDLPETCTLQWLYSRIVVRAKARHEAMKILRRDWGHRRLGGKAFIRFSASKVPGGIVDRWEDGPIIVRG